MMDVKSEINHLSATQKELVIEAPAEMVQKEFDKTYAALSRSAKVAGFRPGKVPRSVIKQKFHREARDTVTGQLVPQAIRTALEKHHLQLISEPKIHDVSLQEGQPLIALITLALAALNAGLMMVAIALFDRESILTRWK